MPDDKQPRAPLTFEAARHIAGGCRLIPDCARDELSVEALAHVLVNLCVGYENWTPTDQAVWLTQEAIDNWDKWLGVPGLKRLFAQKFPKIERVDVSCPECHGSGWRITARGEATGAERCSCGSVPRPAGETPLEEKRKELEKKPSEGLAQVTEEWLQ